MEGCFLSLAMGDPEQPLSLPPSVCAFTHACRKHTLNQRVWKDLGEAVGGMISGSMFANGLTALFGRVWVYTGPVFAGTVSY